MNKHNFCFPGNRWESPVNFFLCVLMFFVAGGNPLQGEEIQVKVKAAHIKLSGKLSDGNLSGDAPRTKKNLHAILERIAKATEDPEILSLFLELETVTCGMGALDELTTKIDLFRKTGKKLIAFTSSGDSKDILLGVGADELWMPESAWMMLLGVRSEILFYKELFDLIGVKAEFLKVGDFKSAVEPFTRTSLSGPARKQMAEMLDDFFNFSIVGRVVKSRQAKGLTPKYVIDMIDRAPFTAGEALKGGLIDHVGYRYQAQQRALEVAGKGSVLVSDYAKQKTEELDFSNPFSLLKVLNPVKEKSSKQPKIAVVFAVGDISSGKSSSGITGEIVGDESIIEAIRQAEDDATVKAIVLRIDSPGGSALASDLIWAELMRCKKPLVASMGDIAASGGYYIAMPARRIFADPSTITGSIGVFGGKIAYAPAFSRIGLKTEVISRGANTGLLSGGTPFNDSERLAMTKLIESTYAQFISKAVAGRIGAGKNDFTTEKLNALAGGRVWTGRQAMENGLVDELGGLDSAISWVRNQTDMARDKKPEIMYLPKTRGFFDGLLDFDLGIHLGSELGLIMKDLPTGIHDHVIPALKLAQIRGGSVYMLPINPLSIR